MAALAANLERARALAPRSRLMAVVKADAYGHGLLAAAQALHEADGFAVLTLDEAERLRLAGIKKPVLLLEGLFEPGEITEAARLGLSLVVHEAEQLAWLKAYRGPGRFSVFLKLDTGMHRLGFMPPTWGFALASLEETACVADITLMTHFASADLEGGVAEPLARFERFAQGLPYPCSTANSAALLRHPETHGEWVRPGLMLYGASPFAGSHGGELGLTPAMTLSSAIIAVKDVLPGGRIGYGGSFVAERAMRIGIVACGYADGYPRHAGTGTPVLVAGRRTRTLGRVSMDMLCVDLSHLPEAGVGSPVILWGEGLPVEEVAAAAGTVSYELLTARTARVPLEVA